MSDTIPSYHITRTLLGVVNELSAISDIALNPRLDTTLNSKYGVKADTVPSSKPKVIAFGCGIDGFRNIDDGNLSAPINPKMTNMDLHSPVPIRCVPVDEDLTEAERAGYRMRVRQTFDGGDYWCYYLKLLNFTSTDIAITQTDPDTQEEVAYELDPANLNPTPVAPTVDGVVTTTGSEVNVLLNAIAEVTGAEIFEGIGAIYGDTLRANISEIGIYTGVDQIVTGLDYQDNQFNYTELIYSQLAIHYCSIGTPLLTSASEFKRTIKLGKSNVLML